MFTRCQAKSQAKEFISRFSEDIVQANMVGSWVRDPKKHKWVSDIDLLCVSKRKIYHGPPLDIWFCKEDQWEAALLYLSVGQLNITMSARAKWRGYKFTWRGLFKRGRVEKLITTDPEEICEIIEYPMPRFAKKTIYENYGRLK
jgi:DNA polymerase/3'-5' exonuclease PolX